MSHDAYFALMPFVVMGAAIMGALVGWFGNFHVQRFLHERIHRADNLRQLFYDYLRLTADYWHGEPDDNATRGVLEGKMIVSERIISVEISSLAKRYGRFRKFRDATSTARLELWDSATGGCFQQEKWSPNPDRVRSASSAVAKIVSNMN